MIHNPDASLSRTSLPRIDHKRFVKLVYASLILHNLCTVRKDDAVTFEGADKQWLEFFRRAEASACPSCTRYYVHGTCQLHPTYMLTLIPLIHVLPHPTSARFLLSYLMLTTPLHLVPQGASAAL